MVRVITVASGRDFRFDHALLAAELTAAVSGATGVALSPAGDRWVVEVETESCEDGRALRALILGTIAAHAIPWRENALAAVDHLAVSPRTGHAAASALDAVHSAKLDEARALASDPAAAAPLIRAEANALGDAAVAVAARVIAAAAAYRSAVATREAARIAAKAAIREANSEADAVAALERFRDLLSGDRKGQ